MQGVIRKAGQQDLANLREFLTKANLGTDGLTVETINYFLVLEDFERNIKGSLGMEVFADFGLLRSLVVSPMQAEKQIFGLFNEMLRLAKERGMNSLFLATNKITALPFFELLGFHRIEREEFPSELSGSEHIRHIFTVDNSIFLKFSL